MDLVRECSNASVILGAFPGGGTKKKLIRGDSPRGPTPYPFKYHFWQKRNPFRIPSIEKWYPFRTTQ